jgi:hypothetical protein
VAVLNYDIGAVSLRAVDHDPVLPVHRYSFYPNLPRPPVSDILRDFCGLKSLDFVEDRADGTVFNCYSKSRFKVGVVAMFTPAQCRDRAADCRQMAERAPNMRVQGILLDIARTWTRLALEAEQWSQMNRPTSRLKRAFSEDRSRLSVTLPNPLPPPASSRRKPGSSS